MKKGHAVAAALILMVLLSGCTENDLNAARFKCIHLSSQSSQEIPRCIASDSCYSKLESNFSFDESGIPYSASLELHSYKNHLSRSWLYFNKAKDNIKKINRICSSDSISFSSLRGQLDEFRENIVMCFSEVQKAHDKSLATINLLKVELEAQGISLVKEEPLYDDYLVLAKNDAPVQGNAETKEDSYLGRYASDLGKLESLSKSFGFGDTEVSGSLFAKIISYVREGLSLSGGFNAPLLSGHVDSIFSYLEEKLLMGDATDTLNSNSVFEFFNLYNEFAGTGNSLPSEFSEIIASYSADRKALLQRQESISGEVEDNLSSVSVMLDGLDGTYEGIDGNFLSSLYSLTNAEGTITMAGFEFSSLPEMKSVASQRLFSLRNEFSELRQALLTRRVTLGEGTSSLKKLLLSSGQLKSELEYLSTGVLSNIDSVCRSRLGLIKEKAAVKQDELPEELFSLKASLEYRLKAFFREGSMQGRLLLCAETVGLYESYSVALSDREAYLAKSRSELKACMSSLESFFRDYSLNRDSRFLSLSQRFSALKLLLRSSPDHSSLGSTCSVLAADVSGFVMQSDPLKSAREYHKKTEPLIEALRKIIPESSKKKKLIDSLLTRFKEQRRRLGEPFSFNDLWLLDFEDSSKQLYEEVSSLFSAAFSGYLADNAELEVISAVPPEPGKVRQLGYRLSFKNRLIDYKQQVTVNLIEMLPEGSKGAKVTYLSPPITDAYFSGRDIITEFASVPLGSHSVLMDLNAVPVEVSIKRQLHRVSSEKAVFEVSLRFSTKSRIPRLKAALDVSDFAPLQPECFYAASSPAGECYTDRENIVFTIRDVYDRKEVLFYFSVTNPFFVDITDETATQDGNSFLYRKSFSVRNMLPVEVKEAKVFIPVRAAEEIKSVSLFDEYFSSLPLKKAGTAYYFILKGFTPKETRSFTLEFSVDDFREYQDREIRERLLILLSQDTNSSDDEEFLRRLREFLSRNKGKKANDEFLELLREADKRIRDIREKQRRKLQYLRQMDDAQGWINTFSGNLEFIREHFSGEYLSLRKLLEEAEMLLSKASECLNKHDFTCAAGLFEKFRLLQAEMLSLSSIPDFLTEKWIDAKKAFEDNFAGLPESGTKEAKELADRAGLLDSEFVKLLSVPDFTAAALRIKELEGLTEELRELSEKQSGEKCSALSLSLSETEGFIETAENAIKILENNMDGLPEGFFESINYTPPFTEADLKGHKSTLSSLRSEFLAFYSSEPEESCFAGKDKSRDVTALRTKSEEAGSKISKLLDELEKDAQVAYEAAVIKAAHSEANPRAETLLEKAEQAITTKYYLMSIAYSKAASESMSFKPTTAGLSLGSFPYAVLPLIAVMGGAAFFRFRKKEEKRPVKILKGGNSF
jgi:hypothetical protein